MKEDKKTKGLLSPEGELAHLAAEELTRQLIIERLVQIPGMGLMLSLMGPAYLAYMFEQIESRELFKGEKYE